MTLSTHLLSVLACEWIVLGEKDLKTRVKTHAVKNIVDFSVTRTPPLQNDNL